MNPGMLNKRITFQQLVESVNPDTDRIIQEWTDIKTVWCSIKTIKGSEYTSVATTKEHAERQYRFIIRYNSSINNSVQTRIKYQDRIFDIESILHDDEAKRTMTIIANEVI